MPILLCFSGSSINAIKRKLSSAFYGNYIKYIGYVYGISFIPTMWVGIALININSHSALG